MTARLGHAISSALVNGPFSNEQSIIPSWTQLRKWETQSSRFTVFDRDLALFCTDRINQLDWHEHRQLVKYLDCERHNPEFSKCKHSPATPRNHKSKFSFLWDSACLSEFFKIHHELFQMMAKKVKVFIHFFSFFYILVTICKNFQVYFLICCGS